MLLISLHRKSNPSKRDRLSAVDLGLKVFGYAHLDKLVAKDLEIDAHALAKKLKVRLSEGTMGYYFNKSFSEQSIEFGTTTREQVREIVKQHKHEQKRHNRTK